MGNSQSNEISDEYSRYIEEQKLIIESQQNQINRLSQLNQPVALGGGEGGQLGNIHSGSQLKETKKQPKKEMTNTEKIRFILKIFELREDYDETALKKAYMKLAMKHHPDKGGDANSFKKITQAYKYLLKKLSEQGDNKDHNELKSGNTEFVKNQMSDSGQNINLSDKFDSSLFNKIYDDNRQETSYDSGYGEWQEKTQFKSDKIEKQNITKGNFNNAFQENKKKRVNKDIIPYGEPKVSISFKGKDSLSILGDSRVEDFSGESSSGLQYRDYKDAYSNTYLIDENSIDISKRSNTLKQASRERKNISYKLSDEDLEKQRKIQIIEERNEKERIERLQSSDNKAFSTYDAIHQRMLGR